MLGNGPLELLVWVVLVVSLEPLETLVGCLPFLSMIISLGGGSCYLFRSLASIEFKIISLTYQYNIKHINLYFLILPFLAPPFLSSFRL
jgi:hypothetical protein